MFAAEQASHSMYLNDQVNRKNTNKKYVMTSQVKPYSLRFWACGSPTMCNKACGKTSINVSSVVSDDEVLPAKVSGGKEIPELD